MSGGLPVPEIKLPFGKSFFPLDTSKLNVKYLIFSNVLTPIPGERVEDEIKISFSFPFEWDILSEKVSSGDRVLIIASDITRKTGSHIFMPLLVDKIVRSGTREEDIEILFANGIHREVTGEEAKRLLGDKVSQKIAWSNHCAAGEGDSSCEYAGETKAGRKVFLNRKVLEADKVILTGSITFHYLAGFGGGRKSLLPGVASTEDILSMHKMSLAESAASGRNPKATTAILTGNPMHEEMEDVMSMVQPAFLLNTVTDGEGNIVKVFSGNPDSAFKKGCIFLMDNLAVRFKEKVSLVIASCGGYPADINFIQAHKAFEYSKDILRDNGVFILIAECKDGIGNKTFLNWFGHKTPEAMEQALRKHFEVNGQTAYSTLFKTKRFKTILVSSLPCEVVEKMQMIYASNLNEALEKVLGITGPLPDTAIIPQASAVLPYFSQ